MQMPIVKPAPRQDFFAAAPDNQASALALAGEIVEAAARLRQGVILLVSTSPLARPVKDLSAEDLAGFLPRDRLPAAATVATLLDRLGSEAKMGDYILDELADELARMPAYLLSEADTAEDLFRVSRRGLRIAGLPADGTQIHRTLSRIGGEFGIAPEYLLGNVAKLAKLIRRFGVRDETINVSGLFHNFVSGFFEVDLDHARQARPQDLLARAAVLEAQGTLFKVFRKGDFNRLLSRLSGEEFAAMSADTAADYQIPDAAFRRFLDALMSREEARLKISPELDLAELLALFKFAEADRALVSHAAAPRDGEPEQWRETELGKALEALRTGLTWLTVSMGTKAAGDQKAALKNREARAGAAEIRRLAAQRTITVVSGRGGARAERNVHELGDDELLFDLYCLAVLERRAMSEVVQTARDVLRLVETLESPEPAVRLDDLVTARLAGETAAAALSANGLLLTHFALIDAQSRLKALGEKLQLTIDLDERRSVPLERATAEQFRAAVVLMGRRLRSPDAPGNVLALIRDKIVPEIKRLPKAVIAPGAHDLGRIVSLAAAGVPARYPLRRPWTRVNLDPLTTVGSGVAPGVRNCLGCPVNSFYGLITKTALATGFDEIITYEATGCFEVYTGIWPYTGKKHPSLHGVFGGAPSELMGGAAAKRARLKYAQKVGGEDGSAQRAALKRTLHLGWGGDGGTFDIGFGNLSGLFSRMQKLEQDELDRELGQRAVYVCYDNEGYQNTGNQYSAASSPGGDTTTNPQGREKSMGNELKKKRMVEIMAEHGATVSARMNIHRQEHITRVVCRALEDGIEGSFLHFLQPCTTGWKFTADSLTYDLAYLSEEGGLFPPVTFEHGVPYLEMYPTPRNPGEVFLRLQARFKHLLGASANDKRNAQRVMQYFADEWRRNLELGGYEGEIPLSDRLGYLEDEHRGPRINV